MLYLGSYVQPFLYFIRLHSFLHWRDMHVSGVTDLVACHRAHADPGKVTDVFPGAQLWQHGSVTDLRSHTPYSAAARHYYVFVAKKDEPVVLIFFFRYSLKQRKKREKSHICWWVWTSSNASRKWTWDKFTSKTRTHFYQPLVSQNKN